MLIFVFLFSKMIFLLQSSEWQWRLKNMNGERAVNDSWAHTELNIRKRWLLSKQSARTEQSREQKLWMMNAGWVNGEHTLSTRWIDTEQTLRKHKKGTRTVSRNIEIEYTVCKKYKVCAFVYNSYMYNEYLHIILKQIHFLDWKTLKTCSWPLTTREISCDGIFLVGKVVWTAVCETAAPCDMPASLWLMTKQHPKKRISCIAIGSQSLKSEINILVLV